MVRTEREMVGIYGQVLLTTNPAPAGFLSRYILCVTPVLLVVISLVILEFMRILVSSFLPLWGKDLALIVPDLPLIMEIAVLCISPVGILLFFIYLGDVVQRPEIWIGSALTLILSFIGCPVFFTGNGYTGIFHKIPADSFTLGSVPGSTRGRDGCRIHSRRD